MNQSNISGDTAREKNVAENNAGTLEPDTLEPDTPKAASDSIRENGVAAAVVEHDLALELDNHYARLFSAQTQRAPEAEDTATQHAAAVQPATTAAQAGVAASLSDEVLLLETTESTPRRALLEKLRLNRLPAKLPQTPLQRAALFVVSACVTFAVVSFFVAGRNAYSTPEASTPAATEEAVTPEYSASAENAAPATPDATTAESTTAETATAESTTSQTTTPETTASAAAQTNTTVNSAASTPTSNATNRAAASASGSGQQSTPRPNASRPSTPRPSTPRVASAPRPDSSAPRVAPVPTMPNVDMSTSARRPNGTPQDGEAPRANSTVRSAAQSNPQLRDSAASNGGRPMGPIGNGGGFVSVRNGSGESSSNNYEEKRLTSAIESGGRNGRDLAALHQQRALLLLNQGDNERAVPDFRKAIELYSLMIQRRDRVREAQEGLQASRNGLRIASQPQVY